MKKKKVSFDIDSELYVNIQEFCKNRGIKQSDFYRDASLEKYEKEINNIVIFIPYNGTIKKFTVDRHHYFIDLREASEELRENVGAICEGTIEHHTVRFSNEMFSSEYKNPLEELEDILNQFNKVAFYTQEKYPLSKKNI